MADTAISYGGIIDILERFIPSALMKIGVVNRAVMR